MGEQSRSSAAILGLCIGMSIVAAAHLIGSAFQDVRASQRYVTVKGFSEEIVPADLVVWPITFQEAENDLAELQRRLEGHRREIREFLEKTGFTEEELSEQPPQITDFKAEVYGGGPERREYRYMARETITLRTEKIDQARRAMKRSGDLVQRGIVLGSQGYGFATQYLFTGLEAIKPGMIAEATRDARRAAEQFARDSGSGVGAIRTARQGFFTIEDRDPGSPDYKKVRVVTTVEYFLLD